MDPVRWRQVESLLDAALQMPERERSGFLDGIRDPALRREVGDILAADAAADSGPRPFLEQPLADFAAPLWGPETPREPGHAGTMAGPFRLLREIGRGGMGAVYLAERADGGFAQTVALKLLPAGLASEEQRSRFGQERQILARLEHPGIARLVDGGVTADGLPYFAMELVEGEPITAYCDRLGLGIAERLRLFRQVCQAVQYAHGHLIVHRDIKPSNVLVTPDGRVKLVDFGIAKVLEPVAGDEGLTRTFMRVLTPEWASPEQVRGEPVTVASDVYQLGLLLYELLAGRRPYTFDRATPAAIDRVVCETDPLPASTAAGADPGVARARKATPRELVRMLRGDLDNVVAMALRKEPERRYAGVAMLVDDLDRHRRGLPVHARADTLGYRTGKFFRRHPVGTVATLAFVLLLAAYAVTVTRQARRLSVEREQVRIEARKAERVKDFLSGLFAAANPYADRGTDVTAGELVEAGIHEIETSLSDEPEVRAEMLSVLSEALAGMGALTRASEIHEEALAIRRAVADGADDADDADLAAAIDRSALLRVQTGDYRRGEELAKESLAMRRRLFGDRHESVATSLTTLGAALIYQGRAEEAEARYRRALAIYEDLAPGGDDPARATLLDNLGIALTRQGETEDSIEAHRAALAMRRRLLDRDDPALAESFNNVGIAYLTAGRFVEAERMFREDLERNVRVLGDHHVRTALSWYNLGLTLRRAGRLDLAVEAHRRALAIRREVLGERDFNVGFSLNGLAAALRDHGQREEAEAMFRESLAILRDRLPPDHPLLTNPELSLGRMLAARGATSEAEPLLAEALAIRTAKRGEASVEAAEARLGLGLCRAAQGRSDEARELLEAGLSRLRDERAGDRGLVAEAEATLQRLG